VVLLNGVSATDPADPELLMMVLVGGKNRTLAEFHVLAASAGLKVVSATPQGRRHVVECRPRT
jgi:hypothetical protein